MIDYAIKMNTFLPKANTICKKDQAEKPSGFGKLSVFFHS